MQWHWLHCLCLESLTNLPGHTWQPQCACNPHLYYLHTLESCLKNAASVCTSTIENEPEIVVLLSFIQFDFHERPCFGYIHMKTLDLTGQLVKIPHNHHRISDNLPMTCKWRVLACCNRSGKMLYNPNGGNKLKLFMVFGENGLGIGMSCFINLSASVVWSFSKFESRGKTILSTAEAISMRRQIPGNIF